MPIYEPKDYEDVIARIQKKVIETSREWSSICSNSLHASGSITEILHTRLSLHNQ